jgi:hypothetical protein
MRLAEMRERTLFSSISYTSTRVVRPTEHRADPCHGDGRNRLRVSYSAPMMAICAMLDWSRSVRW